MSSWTSSLCPNNFLYKGSFVVLILTMNFLTEEQAGVNKYGSQLEHLERLEMSPHMGSNVAACQADAPLM
jgi:hypothetical protein